MVAPTLQSVQREKKTGERAETETIHMIERGKGETQKEKRLVTLVKRLAHAPHSARWLYTINKPCFCNQVPVPGTRGH
jgi:hypothetical protein